LANLIIEAANCPREPCPSQEGPEHHDCGARIRAL